MVYVLDCSFCAALFLPDERSLEVEKTSYPVLALRRNAVLGTLDGKLLRAAEKAGIRPLLTR